MKQVLAQLKGRDWLMASLLYGAGLRLIECLRLKVKDIDFEFNQVIIQDAKGGKDRVTLLPESIRERLKHLIKVKKIHSEDLRDGYGTVELPYALGKKYPNAPYDWGGSTFFLHPNDQEIPAPELSTVTISMNPFCRKW